MQLGLAHGAFEAKQQSVIEYRGMIDAVSITDQRVSETAQIDEAVPIGIVAGEARNFEAKHEADMSERDFGREPREA
jgi:hypothetical protein